MDARPSLDLAATWNAAHANGVLLSGHDRGWIEVHGRDTVEFLHRLLTSDVHSLEPGRAQWSAWLDGRGRWLADLLLFRLPEAAGVAPCLALDMPAEREEAVAEALERHRFAEEVEWRRPGYRRTLLLSAGADAEAGDAGGIVGSGEDAVVELRRGDRGCGCREWLGPEAAVRRVERDLGLPWGDSEVLEVLRIAAFQPRFGHDFGTEGLLPEAEEWRRVSPDKGCYPGQEVVAKILTYGEAPWRLVRLRCAEGVPDLAGAALETEAGEEAGRVTSWAMVPGGGSRGIGRVRRKHAAAAVLHALGASGPIRLQAELPPAKDDG